MITTYNYSDKNNIQSSGDELLRSEVEKFNNVVSEILKFKNNNLEKDVAFVFDFDDTLVKTASQDFLKYYKANYPASPELTLRSWYKDPHLWGTMDLKQIDKWACEVIVYLTHNGLQPALPARVDVLKMLKNLGARLYVATSRVRDITEEVTYEKIQQMFGDRDFFDGVYFEGDKYKHCENIYNITKAKKVYLFDDKLAHVVNVVVKNHKNIGAYLVQNEWSSEKNIAKELVPTVDYFCNKNNIKCSYSNNEFAKIIKDVSIKSDVEFVETIISIIRKASVDE